MRKTALMVHVSLLVSGVLGAGCTPCSPQPRRSLASDPEWGRFLEIVAKARSHHDEAEAVAARKRLALEETENFSYVYCGYFQAATRTDENINVHPIPEPGYGDCAVLASAGNVRGNGVDEFVLTLGWYGPTNGMVCVYDRKGSKLAEFETDNESVHGLQLRDLDADGQAEIIIWTDSHPGTGMWYRYLQVLKVTAGNKIVAVFHESLYACNNCGMNGTMPLRQSISFEQSAGQAATILVQSEAGATRYQWNSASQRFEKQ